ncbi:gamma-glutamyltransferase [Arthrobacter crystallopoietes]|uniref:Glutathione hydrolase proenzyme n=1 Tax=Crystallibacter crystallopoietes TaxID=37928 RepID=A0A1H1D8L2_9MICC|nr:gamma-glutamyltransferase [Arthrobacter crystallopoietes]AUI50423.1 gamma-glutamyltransferase [Arthrobacter crystallopoietes]SDQ72529.1 gamma-glutamyltranspeptidase / glutathione hydrolase [Arthrobacter crystallopoietes]
MAHLRRRFAAFTAALVMSLTSGTVASPAFAHPTEPDKTATARGYGGAVSTVDPEASAAALRVLRKGGNAVDAAVAAAATLGVTEPYSAGIGGGGYFMFYDAETGEVSSIDGRETAPEAMPHDAFIDPETGEPYPFTPELVTSGVSVGVPGTPATWERALDRWGTVSLREALKPAIKVASRGFEVDETFRQQTLDNKIRFEAFTSTTSLFLPDGDAPAVGSTFKNHDLAKTYRLLAKHGTDAFYDGPLAEEIAATVQDPPKTDTTKLPVPVGHMTTADLAEYEALDQDPAHVEYRGLDVYGMAPSSSGGTTVGEALNILDTVNLSEMTVPGALHHYLEASALAFADRGKYVGDPAFVDVPTDALTDPLFGKERACHIDPLQAAEKPVTPGDVSEYDGVCPAAAAAPADEKDTENISTTNLTVADRWGNVVEYTLTIEQTGGSGIVVPGRGFLLNNELTDFSTVYDPADPNRIEPGKRPRSSMSPTIILEDGEPFLALGSPGGSTIITTVLQTILNRVDLGMDIPEAIAAPRASQRNTASVTAEPKFIDAYESQLKPYGHELSPAGDSFTSAAEIGAATAIEFMSDGSMVAAAEPVRRGGGSALVLKPSR